MYNFHWNLNYWEVCFYLNTKKVFLDLKKNVCKNSVYAIFIVLDQISRCQNKKRGNTNTHHSKNPKYQFEGRHPVVWQIQVYIFHVRHNNNILKYTIVSANTFKSVWLHVSSSLWSSSGQHIQIKCLQCAYNMGSHSVYNCNVYNNHY